MNDTTAPAISVEAGTALTVVQRAQMALKSSEYEPKLRSLVASSAEITVITNAAGYQQCHSTRMALKRERVAVEKEGLAARAEATAFAKGVIAEERRLLGIIEPEEVRLSALQTLVDDERERVRAAKETAERARVAGIKTRIANIRRVTIDAIGKPAGEVEAMLRGVLGRVISVDEYAEFVEEAKTAQGETLVHLRTLHEQLIKADIGRAQVEAQRAEMAALQAAEDRRQAEARAALEAEKAVERERVARVKADEKAAKDAADREAQVERDRIAGEERELAARRAAIDKDERDAKDRRDATVWAPASSAQRPGLHGSSPLSAPPKMIALDDAHTVMAAHRVGAGPEKVDDLIAAMHAIRDICTSKRDDATARTAVAGVAVACISAHDQMIREAQISPPKRTARAPK